MPVNFSEYRVHPTGQFSNHAKDYRHIEALPLSSALGAEILGVDLANLSDEQFSEIEDALYTHKMLYIRNQTITLDDQEAFTLRFGAFGMDAYSAGIEGHPNVQRVIKEAENRVPNVFGGSWHTDSPFLAQPPALTLLYGTDIPPYGGDTIWADTQLAYEFLSDPMKQLLAPLRAHRSARNVLATIHKNASASRGEAMGSMKLEPAEQIMLDGSYHPIIRTHPKTGKRALFVDPGYTLGIEGMTTPESEALIGFLCDHITQPAFTARLRWEKNSFVMWDNRSTLHHAFNDYDGFRREMWRTIVDGEVPV